MAPQPREASPVRTRSRSKESQSSDQIQPKDSALKTPGDDARTPSRPAPSLTPVFRALYGVCVLAVCYWHQAAQTTIDHVWDRLRTAFVFQSVYFETWWVTVVYAIILVFPYLASKVRALDRYKIDPTLVWKHVGLRTVVLEFAEYWGPLMLLDSVLVKRYADVDPAELSRRAETWIQVTRALPVAAPSLAQLVTQLALSFVIYDALFCCVHFTLHKNAWLYRHLHAKHHQHDFVHSRVTNQLTVVERVILVLAANQSLKLVHAHPLTRALFVPLFVAWLTENHCGYDLPWTLDKVVPFGLVGGARQHADHHTHGGRNYQPFFTYIDRSLAAIRKAKQV